MKRKIALVLIFLILLATMQTFAAVTGEKGYAFADDSARITTDIRTDGDIATLDVYISGGIYGFTGLSVGYEYDESALTLLNNDGTPADETSKDVINRSMQKIDVRLGWVENVVNKPGQIRYLVASGGEFASYKNGESEKLFSLKFKINTPNGVDSISYFEDGTVITCGDTSIYSNPKKLNEKMLDGRGVFVITKNFAPDYIEITDKTYEKMDTIYLDMGQTRNLHTKSQMPTAVSWDASGDAVSINEEGKVTALAVGKATVTVTDAFGNTDDIEIVVQETKVRPDEIRIICPDTVMAGEMLRPTYEMYPENITSSGVIWSLEGENALLLTSDPVFWAISEGEVLLRVSLEANVSFYTEKIIKIVPAPKSSEKAVTGSFLVPEKLYAKPGKTTVFDITPKLFNVAGAPIKKDAYSEFYDIEYTTTEAKGVTFENGILTVSPDAAPVTECEITATVKYKVDGKVAFVLKSNKFCVYNAKLNDVQIDGTQIIKADFETGIYEVASDDFEIVPVSDGQVYSVEVKNGDVTDVYFFSSDKKGVMGYNFDYMIKHISVQVVK